MAKTSTRFSKGHFRKHWQNFVKTWFNQPSRKIKRRTHRKIKEMCFLSDNIIYKKLKPLVHCPTHMYNMKIRLGRGFSLKEVKKANISKKYLNTIGINLDKRRRSKNLFQSYNIGLLKKYSNEVVFFEKKVQKHPVDIGKIYTNFSIKKNGS